MSFIILRSAAWSVLRRSREDILYGILKSCSSDKLSIYQLMVTVNLSYKSLKSCLDELATSNLVTIQLEKNRKTVSTTPEGVKAASLYRSAISTLKKREESANGKYSGKSILRTISSKD
jgi:predicted transcriptional regulator